MTGMARSKGRRIGTWAIVVLAEAAIALFALSLCACEGAAVRGDSVGDGGVAVTDAGPDQGMADDVRTGEDEERAAYEEWLRQQETGAILAATSGA